MTMWFHLWTFDTHEELVEMILRYVSEKSGFMTIIDMDTEDTKRIQLKHRLTLREQSVKSRIKYISMINLPEDPMRVMYSYLSWFEANLTGENEVYMVINGLCEHLSIVYSKILSKIDENQLSIQDFQGYSVSQVILVFNKMQRLNKMGVEVVINDPKAVVDRLDHILFSRSKGFGMVKDFKEFDRDNLVSLGDLLNWKGKN
ncbi:hypothetical protein FOA43_001330 [Brettanomyces nanus]|uniref:Uncharacterized protein n=1 Tax=Eeniella nana TaxID=13502 RepID=A0A875RZD2_EENNA|nr:uncharacterized protein FOA43_001330 [Brettanomyces nanus]QPG74013.1 hypothetical protein FOA43_001330 [Brettanomyces nanus]